MNKKIILSLGTIASVATPIAAVVSCGDKSPQEIMLDQIQKNITRHANEELVLNVDFNLDTLSSPGVFDSWYSSTATDTWNRMSQNLESSVNSAKTKMQKAFMDLSANPTNEEMAAAGQSVQEFKQVAHNEFAKMHTITTRTTITYKGNKSIVDPISYSPFDEIDYDFFNSLKSQRALSSAMSTMKKSIENVLAHLTSEAYKDWVWAFFSSTQYIAWYKDKVTDAGVDATHLTSISDTFYPVFVNPFTLQPMLDKHSASSKTISLPLMPTRAQVNSYFDDCMSAVRSGMSTAS